MTRGELSGQTPAEGSHERAAGRSKSLPNASLPASSAFIRPSGLAWADHQPRIGRVLQHESSQL